jgi:hypothetical protein
MNQEKPTVRSAPPDPGRGDEAKGDGNHVPPPQGNTPPSFAPATMVEGWPVPEEAVRGALAAAAPYIVAATLRQAAERVVRQYGASNLASRAAADLRRWADEAQP